MKKVLSMIMLFVLIASMVGCSSSKKETENNVSENKAGGSETEEEVTTIKLALWDYDADGSVYPPILEAFQAKYPDIKVDVVSSSASDYETKLSTMLSGGDDIDVFFAKSNTSYPTIVLKDFAMELTDLIKENNFDLSAFGTVLDQHYKIDGNLYALPFRTNDWVIYYNKDMFDEKGIDYPTNDMTWEEYAELGKEVTYDENYGIGFFPKPGFIVPVLVGVEDGFDIISSDFSALEYPLEYMLKIMNEDKTYEDFAQSMSMNQDQTYFYKGTTGMFYDGSWFTQMLINEEVDFEWGIAKSPYWEGTSKNGFATSTPVLINKYTENADAAWKLLSFLTGEEGAKLLAEQKLVPSYMTSDVMEIFNTSTGLDENSMDALTDNITYALGEPSILLGLISGAINEEVELVMTNNQSPEEAVVNMEARRAEIIEANK